MAAMSPIGGAYGSTITLRSDTRAGYTFSGWYFAASGTLVGAAGASNIISLGPFSGTRRAARLSRVALFRVGVPRRHVASATSDLSRARRGCMLGPRNRRRRSATASI